ncbi:MAG: hypothetical protein AAF192_00250 [Pseudomonadota bacterium]
MAAEHDEQLDREGQLADCRRSTRYHIYRMRFFQLLAKIASAVSLAAGTTAAGSLLASGPAWLPLWASGTVVAAQVIELVVQASQKATLHRSLADAFITLEREIVRAGAAFDPIRVQDQMLEIEMREPPVYRALDIMAHNEVAFASNRQGDACEVRLHERLLAHFIAFASVDWEARRLPENG